MTHSHAHGAARDFFRRSCPTTDRDNEPLFCLPSLAPQQTPRPLPLASPLHDPPAYDPPSPDPRFSDHTAFQTFRHSGWQPTRDRIRDAIAAMPNTSGRLARWDKCGTCATLQRNKHDRDAYRVVAQTCNDRFCFPCARRRAGRLARRLLPLITLTHARFVTLTIRSRQTTLKEAIRDLMMAWKKFIRLPAWTRTQDGAIAFLEVTRNPETRLWHPHLHVIALGRYVPQAYLQDAWSHAVGENAIVDIRKVKSAENVTRYVVTYVTKGWPHSVTHCPEAAAELVSAIHRVRIVVATGSLRGHVLVREESTEEEWEDVEQLSTTFARARGGDQEARRILDQVLRGAAAELDQPPPPE